MQRASNLAFEEGDPLMRRISDTMTDFPAPEVFMPFFDEATCERGISYWKKQAVLYWNPEGEGVVAGFVQGTKRLPYEVQARYNPAGVIETECECAVSVACKHAVALLLAAFTNRNWTGSAPMQLAQSCAPCPAPPAVSSEPLLEASRLPAEWTNWLQKTITAKPAQSQEPIRSGQNVLYVLQRKRDLLFVDVLVARPLQQGGYGASQTWGFSRLESSIAECVSKEDRYIGKLFRTGRDDDRWSDGLVPDDPEILDLVLRKIISTGRAFFQTKDNPPLKLAAERTVGIGWHLRNDGSQAVGLSTHDHVEAVCCALPWFIDKSLWESGPLRFDLPKHLVDVLLKAPHVAPADAQAVSMHLKNLAGDVNIPLPQTSFKQKTVNDQPKVILRLLGRPASFADRDKFSYPLTDASRPFRLTKVPHASLRFDYEGKQFDSAANEYRCVDGDTLIISKPDLEAESQALEKLTNLGLMKLLDYDNRSENLFCFSRHEASIWLCFMDQNLDKLRQSGWKIEIDDSFPFRTVSPDEGEYWSLNATEGVGFWFSVDIGIKVDGKRMPLLPVLVSALKALDPNPTLETIDKLNFNGQFLAPMPDGQLLALPFERVRLILTSFVEFFDVQRSGKEEKLSVSLMQAAQLKELADKGGWQWSGPKHLNEMIDRLSNSKGIQPIVAPKEFKTTLRDYQREGLGWLQFLKQFDLGGILADDMGLGKTVQALAHLCLEKANGNLDLPALIVCPTSVLPNWIKETERFAPHLKIVSLHGPGRRLSDGRSADIAITTYALLRYDLSWFAKHEWSNVILDEAQAIKNPKTVTALAAKCLKAKQRICLTGTPVENHLGELWSQFDFLMPGILGTRDTFGRRFRVPIEAFKSQEAKRILATRVRPFILRRTKEQVAAELPAKTDILQRFALEGDQRDLYETVRLAMHERVQQEIATKGFNRSQIIILEALLRLRQVCCDPRLVKMPAARGVKSSAKLSVLKEMLAELLQQDRKILLFSQFTSMLDLIVPELKALDCSYVEIRGDTKDRLSPVEQFQNGNVPVFLLSLKAGGTGLNLTAADTVIHYDPWWNPAVENQATDRAHRIGQTKPVFVYKLIALGTVEDRMLQLQEKKKAIADSIYEHEKEGNLIFDEDDLELLFKPLD